MDVFLERAEPGRAAESEAIRKVRSVALTAGQAKPPVQLDVIARHLGISDVAVVPLAMNGRLLLEPSGRLKVQLSDQLSLDRRRFVFAHELAHIVIEGKRIGACQRQGLASRVEDASQYDGIEDLCDAAASEFLLPRDWIEDHVDATRPSLETVRDVSDQSGCGLEYTAQRIMDLALWRGPLFVLERSDDRWTIVQTFGRPEEFFTDETFTLVIAKAIRDPDVEQIALFNDAESDLYHGTLEFVTASGQSFRLWAEFLPNGDGQAICLVTEHG